MQQLNSFKDNPRVIEAFRGFLWGEVCPTMGYGTHMKYIMKSCGIDSGGFDDLRDLCGIGRLRIPESRHMVEIPDDAWHALKLLDVVPPDRQETLRCGIANIMVKEYARGLEEDNDIVLMQYVYDPDRSLRSKIATCIICMVYCYNIPCYEMDSWIYISRDETVSLIIQGFSDVVCSEFPKKIILDGQSLQSFFDFCCRYVPSDLQILFSKYLGGENKNFAPPEKDWPESIRRYPDWLLEFDECRGTFPSGVEMRKALGTVRIFIQGRIMIIKGFPKWLHSITSLDSYCAILFAFLRDKDPRVPKVTYGLDLGIMRFNSWRPLKGLFVSHTGFVHTDVLVFEVHISLERINSICRVIQEHIRLRQLLWDNDESFMILWHHKSFENHRVNLLFNDDARTHTWAEKMAKGLLRCSRGPSIKICDDNVSVQCVDENVRFFFFSWPDAKCDSSNKLSYRAKYHIEKILRRHNYPPYDHYLKCHEIHEYYNV